MTDLNPQLLISTFLLNSRLTCLSVQVSFRSCCSCFLCSQAFLLFLPPLLTGFSVIAHSPFWSEVSCRLVPPVAQPVCGRKPGNAAEGKRAAVLKDAGVNWHGFAYLPLPPDLIQSITSLHPTFHTKYKWGVLSSSLQWHCVASWDGHKEHLFILSSSSLV